MQQQKEKIMSQPEAEELAVAMAAECLAVRVRILSRVLTACYDREMRPLKLKASQGAILVCVARAGEIDQTGIGRRLKMEKSTVSRAVERMKSAGWLEECGADSRSLRLSESGRELLGRFHHGWLRAQAKARELLGEDGARDLKKLTAPIFHR